MKFLSVITLFLLIPFFSNAEASCDPTLSDNMCITITRLDSNYISVSVSGGSGESPYYWLLNNQYTKTTTSRNTTYYYTQSSLRLEVSNENACGTGQNTVFFTGFISKGTECNY